MKKILATILMLLTFSVNARDFNRMVTFGDSLSDPGNLYRYLAHVLPKSPPYYQGRFSNGPLWSEILYRRLFNNKQDEAKHNYAVGGAAAVFSEDAVMPYTLATEVTDYFYLNDYKNKKQTLFNIWIGANNYLRADKGVDELTDQVVLAIKDNIEQLIAHGAEMFLITNLPDIGRTPDAKENNNEALLTEYSRVHNVKLKAMVDSLKNAHPQASFAFMDVGAVFSDVMARPEMYGVTNTADACYEGGVMGVRANTISNSQYLAQESRKAGLALTPTQIKAIVSNPSLRTALRAAKTHPRVPLTAKRCQGYAFWDHVHPTHTLHLQIAHEAEQALIRAGLQAKAE